MRRARALLVFALVLAFQSCDTQGDVHEPDGETAAPQVSERESLFEALPDSPKIEIAWENTVVDIEPTSRFREKRGGPDRASVRTTLALPEEPDDETRKFLEGLEGVDVTINGTLVHLSYVREVEQAEDNSYTFEISAPVDFGRLPKNGDVSLIILLPREAQEYDDAPNYEVNLDGFTEGTPKDNVEVFEVDEAPGRRLAVALYERTDPRVGPIYVYLPP